MPRITSILSRSHLTKMKADNLAELERLEREAEYLHRRLKLNAECVEFMNFCIKRRDEQIAEAINMPEPWSPGYFSYDAD